MQMLIFTLMRLMVEWAGERHTAIQCPYLVLIQPETSVAMSRHPTDIPKDIPVGIRT